MDINLTECRKLLLESSLHSIKELPHFLVILRDTATVDQALKVLANHHILSAPVVVDSDERRGGAPQWPVDKGTKDILGFLDVRDVLSSFLAELDAADVCAMKMLQRMRLLEEKGSAFAQTAIKRMKHLGGDGTFLHCTQSRVSLMELITEGMLEPKPRSLADSGLPADVVHRVAVFDNEGRITNIVTQTDIIRFLLHNGEVLGSLAHATVAQMGWGAVRVASVYSDESAIAAMARMDAERVSALAVLDGAGKIIGNFSVTEMRTIMSEHFGALALPVGEFLALEHGTEFVGYTRIQDEGIVGSSAHRFVTDRVARARPRTPGEEVGQTLVLGTAETTFLQVLAKLVQHHIHRVYIVDGDDRPVGVVTCTDVLRKLRDLMAST